MPTLPLQAEIPSVKAHWQVHGRARLYSSEWVNLEQWDVELPDGSRIPDHHVVTYPRQAVGVVAFSQDGQVLLIKHYRFQTNVTNWEIPAGGLDGMETALSAAQRELAEETGYSAQELSYLGYYHPSQGSSNQIFHVVVAKGLQQTGLPHDENETMDCRWFPISQVKQAILAQQMVDGFSLTALLWAFLDS
ncbi:MAG TPA: NUDIX hydrolase [Anaerolineales bacterium]|nr:NUDIX hydrolase [Anaerolineales bacterium]